MALQCFACDRPATWWAETPDHDVALCQVHYDELIESAEKRNPDLEPGVVRSCMERASYPVNAAEHARESEGE